MFRKTMFALAAIASIATLSLPVEASARGGFARGGGFHGGFHGGFARGGYGWHGGYRRGWGPGVGAAIGLGVLGAAAAGAYGYYGPYGYGDAGCYATQRIWTPYGWRLRTVNVCY